MPRDNQYSQYKLCVCSHMRLVCYTTGKPVTYGERTVEAHGPGWYHVSPSGTLENFSQPCEASIFRFDFEWPADCTTVDKCLVEPEVEGKRPNASPSTKTLEEKYPHRAMRGE